jgi:hypothetical protein
VTVGPQAQRSQNRWGFTNSNTVAASTVNGIVSSMVPSPTGGKHRPGGKSKTGATVVPSGIFRRGGESFVAVPDGAAKIQGGNQEKTSKD